MGANVFTTFSMGKDAEDAFLMLSIKLSMIMVIRDILELLQKRILLS